MPLNRRCFGTSLGFRILNKGISGAHQRIRATPSRRAKKIPFYYAPFHFRRGRLRPRHYQHSSVGDARALIPSWEVLFPTNTILAERCGILERTLLLGVSTIPRATTHATRSRRRFIQGTAFSGVCASSCRFRRVCDRIPAGAKIFFFR